MNVSSLLAFLAVPFAVAMSVVLTWLGLDKFYFIMAGGKRFGAFPDLNSQLGVSSSYLILQLIYFIWLFGVKPSAPVSRFTELLKYTFIFLLLAFISYPISNDVYLYLHFGLMNLSGDNPFLDRAGLFSSQLSYFVDWGQTSTYGPLSQLFFTVASLFVSISPIAAVYAYKTICLVLHVFNGYLIWRSLPISSNRDKLSLAYLINPLLLMEQVGSAHLDVLVCTSAIILVATLAQQKYASAFVALWAGFLAKTLPIVWLPLVSMFLLRHRQWKYLAAATLFSISLVISLSLTSFHQIDAWTSLFNPGVSGQYNSSLHRLVKSIVGILYQVDPRDERSVNQEAVILGRFTLYTSIVFVCFYTWILLRPLFKKDYSYENLTADIGWVTLVLFLIATPWFMPWYVSVLLPIAALVPHARLFGITSLMFSFSSSMVYLLQGYNGIKSTAVIGIPLITLAVGAVFLLRNANPLPGANPVTTLETSDQSTSL